MKQLWYYKQSTTQLKLRIYASYILPLLTYNMGTWVMTKTLETKLDIAHRNHLRKLLKVTLLDKVPNNTLYTRTNSLPLSTLARQARWRLFGHILRLNNFTPANQSMQMHLTSTEPKRRGKPKANFVSTLRKDCQRIGAFSLSSLDDVDYLHETAQDRPTWNLLVREMTVD